MRTLEILTEGGVIDSEHSPAKPQPNFSVIVTCYNKEATIEAAIRSAHQQGGDVEIIVVDDKSGDASRTILAGLEVDKVILHETNKGALGAYLTGFRAATGRILVMLDGDDRLAPGILPALAKTGWLNETTCVRLGMTTADDNTELASVDTPLKCAGTFRPGRLFILCQSTGGTAYVFPKVLFDQADTGLAGWWPQITVQDHVLPGMIGLLAKRFIKLKTTGYYMAQAGDGMTLGAQTAVTHHDRLLSDYAILCAAEGPLRQGPVSRFMLRLALFKRMRKLARRYRFKTPISFKHVRPSNARHATIQDLAKIIK
ncbi:glycosyltransferase [Ascidiaceihabitans sp.]|nr:glycosyltransferase [Ascidiaceihabitans sp.]